MHVKVGYVLQSALVLGRTLKKEYVCSLLKYLTSRDPEQQQRQQLTLMTF